MTPQTIATNLRAARIARRWTTGQAEIHTGIQKSNITGYENARAMPGVINLAILCRAYRVSSDDILGITE